MITFGSVCSGIEAASVAWHPLGWRAAWLAEIEAAPSALLAHHYPDVPNYGDMTQLPHLIRDGFVAAPDVFCGGTPCQAFSVAGLRNSLDDARGNLSLTFCEIADAIDARRAAAGLLPAVHFWENVPGVLTTKDNAFGCFLGALAGEDCALEPAGGKWTNAGCVFGPTRTVAWRVFDAQYFGVAQRRRRVFVVASARKGFDPAAVLFEFDGVRRDSAPRRSTWQEVTGTLSTRTTGGGGLGTDFECAGGLPPVDVCPTLQAGGNGTGGERPPGTTVDTCLSLMPIAFDSRQDCVSSKEVFGALGSSSPQAQAVSYAIQAGALRTNPNSGPDGVGIQAHIAYTLEARAEVQAICVTGEITHTLTAEGHDASEDGSGRGQPIVTAFSCKDYGNDASPDLAPTMRAMGHSGSHANAGGQLAVQAGMAVRRLMPVECERLQGFPDGYTLIPVRGKPMADGPRYKALGNSWAVPNVRWIGRRIQAEMERNG